MSLAKDLTVTITNESEGTTLVLKTVSGLGNKVVAVSGDMGVFDLKEIEKALEEIQMFHSMNKHAEQLVEMIGR